MLRLMTFSLLAVVLCAAGVYAHGGMTHVMGTITAVDGSHMTVKTADGKSVTVMLNGETKYLRKNGTASAADLKAGTRVMAEGAMDKKTNSLVAKEVQLPAPAKTAAATSKAPVAKAK